MGFLKNKLNLWLILSFITASTLTIWMYVKLNERVGDISFDSELDSTAFHPCDEDNIFQYYSINTEYKGGKKAIKRMLLSKIMTDQLPENGLLTVRFVVNCHGEPGYFRTKMIDPDLNDIDITTDATDHLYTLISELKDWVPGQIHGEARDSYVQIVFMLDQGKIIDIF